jgi:hypothetical protein
MDYAKHYNNLMSTRLLLKPERHKMRKSGQYFEGHHIIPKSKGGTGISSRGLNNDNIVYLTAREHFLAHWLLWRIHRDRSSALSFHKMLSCNKNQERIKSSRAYNEARLAFSETNKGNQYGRFGKGKKMSEERKAEVSKFMKGRWSGENNPFFGMKHTDETKKILSEKRKMVREELVYNYKGYRRVIKNDEIIGVFKTTREVADFINCSMSNVRHVLGGTQKSANGYLIQYVNT